MKSNNIMKDIQKQSNIDKFLELYKKIEFFAKKTYNCSPEQGFILPLINDRRFGSYYQKIDYCRKVRNLISHNSKFNDGFPIEPTNEMIAFLQEKIIDVFEKPKKIRDIWIIKEKIRSAKLNDKVLPIMKDMRENKYTHIPIIENEQVVGIFSENTLFEFIINEEIMSIDEKTLVSDFKNLLPLDEHRSESFYFVSKEETLDKIRKMFESNFTENKRIGMIFVTHSGKPTEKMLGIVTPWDVLGKNL